MRRARSAFTWVVTSALTLAVAVVVVAMTAHPTVPTSGRVSAVTPTTSAATSTSAPPSTGAPVPPSTIVRYGGDDGSGGGSAAPATSDN